jgi:lysophospholipase L1-like esterase
MTLSYLPSMAGLVAGFVGSSNVPHGPNGWPQMICDELGLECVNEAIGGTSYTSPNSFLTQLTTMRDEHTEEQRAAFRYIFVGDASNNARGNEAYGVVAPAARTLYTFAQQNFPNAELVVLPMVWPADTARYAPAIIGGYDSRWNASAIRMMAAQRDALADYVGVLFAEESQSWLTGRNDLMTADGDVHPNALGNALIARYMLRVLQGEQITGRSQGWKAATPNPGYALGDTGRRDLSFYREGWTVHYEGSVSAQQAFANPSDWAVAPYGLRPTFLVPAYARWGTTVNRAPVEIWPNGTVRVSESGPAGQIIHLNGSYRLG